MAFVPSQYSDTASTVEALAPLAISAGTQIATTAITGRRGGGRRRHQAKAAPPPPASSGFPVLPALAAGAVVLLGAVGFALSRKKPAAAAA